MAIYQLKDSEGENIGLINSTVKQSIIEEFWQHIYDMPEEDDKNYAEMLVDHLLYRVPEEFSEVLWIEAELWP